MKREENRAEGINILLAQTAVAWRNGDANAYAALFTEDCTYVAFFGSIYRGRQEIAESHRVLFSGPLKNTQIFAEQIDLRFLSDDVALLLTRGEVAASRPSKLNKIQSYLAIERDGKWLFAHFQNTKRLPFMRFLTSLAGSGALPPAKGS